MVGLLAPPECGFLGGGGRDDSHGGEAHVDIVKLALVILLDFFRDGLMRGNVRNQLSLKIHVGDQLRRGILACAQGQRSQACPGEARRHEIRHHFGFGVGGSEHLETFCSSAKVKKSQGSSCAGRRSIKK